jgi:hypothetical protein
VQIVVIEKVGNVARLGKRQENLLAKIAAQLQMDVEEIKDKAAPLYTTEARTLQAQAVLNFFSVRVKLERQMVTVNGKKRPETDAEFEARYREWNFKTCKHCKLEFAYAYTYDGVAYCSLECVDASLAEIGLQVTRNRDPKMRWGNFHPAIVSASSLAELRDVYSDSEGVYDGPVPTSLPKHLEEQLENPVHV